MEPLIQCINCFHMRISQSSKDPEGNFITREGFCHRYPPVYVNTARNGEHIEPLEDIDWYYPVVELMDDYDYGCGEFKAIEPLK